MRDSIKLYELQYTKHVLISSIVTNTGAAVSAAVFFNGKAQVMSSTYMSFMSALEFDNDMIKNIMVNFQLFFLIVILFALTLDTIKTAVKYYSNK